MGPPKKRPSLSNSLRINKSSNFIAGDKISIFFWGDLADYYKDRALKLEDYYQQHQQMNVEGVDVVYFDSHAGKKAITPGLPTVVALHSVPTSGYMYRALRSQRAHYRLIIPDLPGFGRSQKRLTWPAKPSLYSAWLVSFINKVVSKAEPLHLVGHDFGAILALSWALEKPDRISSILILNNYLHLENLKPLYWPAVAMLPWVGSSFVERLISKKMVARFLAKLYAEPPTAQLLAAYADIYQDKAARQLLANFLWHMKQLPPMIVRMRRRLSEIQCPVVVLFGEASEFYRRGVAEKMSANFKVSSYRVLPGVGYQIMDEAPKAVLAELKALIR